MLSTHRHQPLLSLYRNGTSLNIYEMLHWQVVCTSTLTFVTLTHPDPGNKPPNNPLCDCKETQEAVETLWMEHISARLCFHNCCPGCSYALAKCFFRVCVASVRTLEGLGKVLVLVQWAQLTVALFKTAIFPLRFDCKLFWTFAQSFTENKKSLCSVLYKRKSNSFKPRKNRHNSHV